MIALVLIFLICMVLGAIMFRLALSLGIVFWYCFDDALASLTNTSWIGNVHPVVWIIILVFWALSGSIKSTKG